MVFNTYNRMNALANEESMSKTLNGFGFKPRNSFF